MDLKQASRKELMSAGTEEAQKELKIRADRVEAAMKIISKLERAG